MRVFALITFLLISNASAIDAKQIAVTSLSDRGTGTLRACMESSGKRKCDFRTSGVINIRTPITVTKGDLLVDGEKTEKLVELRGAGIRIHGSNTMLRHFAVRPGAVYSDSKTFDGIVVWSKGELKNIVLDHMSLTWAVDENLSSYGPKINGVVISNSIIAEGLHCSIHPKGCHSKGVLWGPDTKNICMYGNLITANHDRNVRMKAGCTMTFANNWVYGWGGTTGWNLMNFTDKATGNAVALDFQGNVYKPAPWSQTRSPAIYADRNIPKTSKVFTADNIVPAGVSGLPASMHSATPLLGCDGLTKASEITRQLIQNVGPRPARRSKTDARIVGEAADGTGSLKDCVEGCPRAAHWD